MGDDLRNAPPGWKDEADQNLAALREHLDSIIRTFDVPETSRPYASTGTPVLDQAINRLFSVLDSRGKYLRRDVSHDGYVKGWINRRHYRVIIHPNGQADFYRDGRRLGNMTAEEANTFSIIVNDLVTRGFQG